jgi:hypothetical protein
MTDAEVARVNTLPPGHGPRGEGKPMKKERIYRRSKRSDCWHFHPECSKQPKVAFIVTTKRKGGELCNECRAKSKKG